MADPGSSAPAMVRRGTATASRGNKGKRKRSSRATSGAALVGVGVARSGLVAGAGWSAVRKLVGGRAPAR